MDDELLNRALAKKARLTRFVTTTLILLALVNSIFLLYLNPLRLSLNCSILLCISELLMWSSLLFGPLRYFREFNYLLEHLKTQEAAKRLVTPYFLLLHSFLGRNLYEETIREPDIRRGNSLRPRPQLMPKISNPLISKINDAIRHKGKLIAVGSRFLVPDRDVLVIEPNHEHWVKVVKVLAMNCVAVFLLPGKSPGVLTEIDLIVGDDLIDKTIVVMPPLRPGRDYTEYGIGGVLSVSGRNIGNWEELRQKLEVKGYQFPIPEESGMVFTLNSDLSVKQAVGLSGDIRNLSEAISTITQHLNGKWLTLSEAYQLIEPYLLKPNFNFEEVITSTNKNPVDLKSSTYLTVMVPIRFLVGLLLLLSLSVLCQ
jgi:hypothetical protein